MTNFQLNVLAANYFYGSDEIATSPHSENGGVIVQCGGVTVDHNFNPCLAPLDCNALTEECSILILPSTNVKNRWMTIFNGNRIMNNNPKRVATIAYILAKQAGL